MRICLVVLLLTASILMAFALDPLSESSRATAQVQNPSTQSDTPAQDPLFPTETPKRLPGTDETFARLITRAESEGPVRVIVGLNTAFRPEGLLPNAQLVEFQREGIAQAQDSLIFQLLSFNARSITRFTFIPFIAMELDAAGLAFLKNSPEVTSIEEDLPRPMTLAQSVPLIGGNAAWASGFTGAGQTVAILDSGVEKTHSFLAGKVVSEACYSTNVDSPVFGSYRSVCPGGVTESTNAGSGVNCSTSLNVDCAHGTHVAGIAAGKGTSFSGVARDANIISIQVFSNPLSGGRLGAFDSNMISGLERVQQLSTSFNIAAVNMSIGGGQNFANCDGTSPAMKTAIDNLRSIRIATVISSGNGDANGNGFPNALSFPACISTAISVGSTDDGSFGTTVNAVSNFSNSASFLHLLAPGRWINSSVPGASFQDFSGTSMAAPHVAGAWAVLRTKAPSATVDQVLQALTSTGLPVTDPKNGLTKPRIRVDAALNALNRVLTIASSNPGSGVSISVSPVDNSNQGDGVTQFSRTYSLNSTVTVTAPATAGGNNFQKWQRDGVDLTNNLSTNVVMDANHTMTAVYVTPPTQTLTVNSSNPASGVSITVSPVDNSSQGNGATPFSRTYNLNTNVTLTAPATAGGNNFQKWQRNGTDFSTDLMINVTMDADQTLTAVYVTPTRTLNVASSNPASGVSVTVSPADNSGQGNGATPFNRTYNLNTNVTLTAPATAGGNNFQKWQRNGGDFSTDLMINVTMDADQTLTAVYVTPTRTLNVASSNPASGVSISVSPADNSSQGNGATPFNRTYNLNTNVTLTAPATAGGNNFQKWQRNGADFSTNPATSVTLDANYTLTAVYVTPTRTLNVASSNPASGVSITVSPADNSGQGNGATAFSRTYNLNTNVSLTAPATAGGNNFQKWQRNGADFSTDLMINVTMDADQTLTAVYVTPTRTLNVASSNPASGVSVTVSPADNSSQGNGATPFNRTYNLNTTVTLTSPAIAGGNNFQKWQRNGVDWSTNRTTSVTMDANYTLTAVYVTPTRTL
ncbi:MAG TPA: S8 family serine peptidase, partial [Pyrinomonadaceae bacterium]|nr:S8 family serine peptidase [Pyrinomonadaceae bacterium]